MWCVDLLVLDGIFFCWIEYKKSVVWKVQAAGHPQQVRMPAVMMLMKTSVVGVSQSLLEVVVLLFGLAEQFVLKLVEYPDITRMYLCPVVALLLLEVGKL